MIRKTLPPPTVPSTSKSLMVAKAGIVRNPTIVGSNQNLWRNIRPTKAPSFQLPSQYLTVSSEETSTYTELEADDLVDVDYISEYSLDLSNDEDEEENFEDIQSEIYLRNLFYTIDRLTFDDLAKNVGFSVFSIIDLPKNLVAECHVWRQKFRSKKQFATKSQQRSSTNHAHRIQLRPRRSNTEQASITRVAEWNVDNSLQQNSTLIYSELKGKEYVSKLERPVNGAKTTSSWLHSTQSTKPFQTQASVSNRITLPPIVNPKRPQSNELTHQCKQMNNRPLANSELTVKKESDLNDQQHKQSTYPLQTSQSFNEQTESLNKTAANRTSASSSYSRITLNDLLDQTSNTSSTWGHRSPAHFPSSHILKLPAIKS